MEKTDAGRTVAYLGLGSNFEDARRRLEEAIGEIARISGLSLLQASSFYRTEPQGYKDQPWFVNCVLEVAVAPSWKPAALMKALLELEAGLGRVRSKDPALRFGPRAIDIDMLAFGSLTSDDPVCLLPHPRLAERAFWLVPLEELAPDFSVLGKSPKALLAALEWRIEGDKIFQ